MELTVKLRLGFLLKDFLAQGMMFVFHVYPRYFPKSAFAVRSNQQALAWAWRQGWTFKLNTPSLDLPMSTNNVFISNLTIEGYF